MSKPIETAMSLESAWAFIAGQIEANEPAGEVVIASGKETNLYVRVKPSRIPANVGLELVRQGIIKPLTDISKDAKQGDESWNEPHQRRLKKVDNWYNGDYAVRGGGVPDPIGAQMKEELAAELKRKGLTAKSHPDCFKGRVGDMLDALVAAGVKLDKEAKMQALREAAVATLAERGSAAKELDLTSIEL
jgi:hypothetical protein